MFLIKGEMRDRSLNSKLREKELHKKQERDTEREKERKKERKRAIQIFILVCLYQFVS